MRVELRQQVSESEIRWRLTEADGQLVHAWLPGLEADDWLPIDRGGYDEQHDAFCFKLAIDLVRAEAGLIDVAPESVEAERLKLDEIKTGRPTKEPQAALDRFADRIRQGPSLDDFAGVCFERWITPRATPCSTIRLARRSLSTGAFGRHNATTPRRKLCASSRVRCHGTQVGDANVHGGDFAVGAWL